MSLRNHFEHVTNTLHDFIVSNYDTYLGEIRTEEGDTIPTPMIASAKIIDGAVDIEDLNSYPVLVIAPDAVPVEYLSSGGNALGMKYQVFIAVGGYRPTWLTKMVERYSAAFMNMIVENPTLGAGVDEATVENIEFYLRPFAGDDEQMVRVDLQIIKEAVRGG